MANLDADGGDIDSYASKEDFEQFVFEILKDRTDLDTLNDCYTAFIAERKAMHNFFDAEEAHGEDSPEATAKLALQDAAGDTLNEKLTAIFANAGAHTAE